MATKLTDKLTVSELEQITKDQGERLDKWREQFTHEIIGSPRYARVLKVINLLTQRVGALQAAAFIESIPSPNRKQRRKKA